MHRYLSPPLPHVLAHRGLSYLPSGDRLDENTLEAFAAAISAGATHIESDLQVTRDGVAVLFHDETLERVAGISSRVSDLTYVELKKIRLEMGGSVPTLAEALEAFPETRFNLDFKTASSVAPAADEIARLDAEGRVLVASFSDRNRAAAKQLLPGCASSGGMGVTLGLLILLKLRFYPLARAIAKDIDALQVPVQLRGVRFATKFFIEGCHNLGLLVHYWTVNDVQQAKELLRLGADGIVTDRTDSMAHAIRHL